MGISYHYIYLWRWILHHKDRSTCNSLQITVLSDDEIPVLQKPVTANCGTKSGLCSFAYSTSVTPVIMSFEVSLFYM